MFERPLLAVSLGCNIDEQLDCVLLIAKAQATKQPDRRRSFGRIVVTELRPDYANVFLRDDPLEELGRAAGPPPQKRVRR